MKPRPIRIEGDIAYVPLTRGCEATIDAAEVCLVEGYNWNASAFGYAVRGEKRNGKLCTIFMHRAIMDPASDMEIDHINHNRLDNRKTNLRVCTRSQNLRNMRPHLDSTSGLKGVSWFTERGDWKASIYVDGKRIHLGYFKCAKKAHEVYTQAAKKHFGEFAYGAVG